MVLTETGLAKVFQRVKSFVIAQLNSKASAIHTHTSSDITDLPNGYVVDSTLDGTSSNAISNSAVKNALDGKSDVGHTHTKSQITDFPSLAIVATSGSYNDLSNKPTIPSNTNQLTNGAGFITTDGAAYPRRVGGVTMNFNWSGQDGQPSWLWGGEDGTNMYVYNPANFSVNYANSAGGVAWGNVSGRPAIPTKTSELTNDSFVRNGNSSANDIILTWGHPYAHLSIDGSYQGGIITSGNIGNFVSTSDRRLKDEIESIPDEILDAWEALESKQFKYKSDLETDKDGALVHYGWIAQDVESVIKGDRKGDIKSGLWQHEFWDEQEEISREEEYTEEVQTKDGTTETVTKTRKIICIPYKAKGDAYGLRYTECLVVECAYLRRENSRLKENLASIEERLEKLEKAENS